jgi:hypothetical protein
MQSFFYELSFLPKVPENLLDYDFSNTDYDITSNIELKKDGRVFRGGSYLRNPIGLDLQQWIRTHVIAEWGNTGFSCISSPCMGPHMDRTRFYTLQYVIETGGSDVDTVFYEAASERLQVEARMRFGCYDDLKEINRFCAAKHTWWMLDGRQIHSVENIQTDRVALQIGLMRNPIEKGLFLS